MIVTRRGSAGAGRRDRAAPRRRRWRRLVRLAPAEQMRVRFQIAAMEGVLERAVQLGARRLSQQVQSVSPDMLVIAGAARAKGFLLEGYGVFFDVDVPAMRRSVAWSFRRSIAAIAAMRPPSRRCAGTWPSSTTPARREMDEAIQRLSRTVGPPMPLPGADARWRPPGVPSCRRARRHRRRRRTRADARDRRRRGRRRCIDDPGPGLHQRSEVRVDRTR